MIADNDAASALSLKQAIRRFYAKAPESWRRRRTRDTERPPFLSVDQFSRDVYPMLICLDGCLLLAQKGFDNRHRAIVSSTAIPTSYQRFDYLIVMGAAERLRHERRFRRSTRFRRMLRRSKHNASAGRRHHNGSDEMRFGCCDFVKE